MVYALADSLSILGRDAEAETYYRQLLRINPTDVSAFLTYGDLLAKNVSNYLLVDLYSQFITKIRQFHVEIALI